MASLNHGCSLAPSCGIDRAITTNFGTHSNGVLFLVHAVETKPTNISTSSDLELPSIPQHSRKECHSIPTHQQEIIMRKSPRTLLAFLSPGHTRNL